jgi:hypothetical protein
MEISDLLNEFRGQHSLCAVTQDRAEFVGKVDNIGIRVLFEESYIFHVTSIQGLLRNESEVTNIIQHLERNETKWFPFACANSQPILAPCGVGSYSTFALTSPPIPMKVCQGRVRQWENPKGNVSKCWQPISVPLQLASGATRRTCERICRLGCLRSGRTVVQRLPLTREMNESERP